MIYGDQSQEGFLLRDYFCCDTNELRLQIHCRPITLWKRPLAYYSWIISGFYPPMLKPLLHTWTFDYIHLSVCMCVYHSPAVQTDSRVLSVTLCCLYRGAPACWFITPALCCQNPPLDCVVGAPISHLCMCHIVTDPEWRICDWRGTLETGDPEKMREERQIKISLYPVIGLLETALSALSTQIQKTKEGGGGNLWYIYTVPVCGEVHVMHSNHLNYFF